MITITPNLAAKAATLDARIAAGEQVTLRLPGDYPDGLTLTLFSASGEALASAAGAAREGGVDFYLDLDTAECLAATAGRDETPCLLTVGSAAEGSRRLLVRQPVSLCGWPRTAADLPPAPLPDTVAQRLAALEAAIAAPPDPRYALVDAADVRESGNLYPADRAATLYRIDYAEEGAAVYLQVPAAVPGRARDLLVDIDNSYTAVPADLGVDVAGGVVAAGVNGTELPLTVPADEIWRIAITESALTVNGNPVVLVDAYKLDVEA